MFKIPFLCKAYLVERGAGWRLRLPFKEPVFLIDVGEPRRNRLVRLSAGDNPLTEIDDNQAGGRDEDEASDN
jgi:hypothetical protein